MQTYNVDFRTDADYAIRQFKARSPRHALKKALAFYDERPEELMFESYDGGHPVNEIEVFGADGGAVAVWHDDDLRRRLAADGMLAALELCVDCLADLARLDDGTPSISALDQARAALAKAKGEPAPHKHTRRLRPPDPEKMNKDRAESAGAALRHFQCTTGTDYEAALGDLLGDLMHWSDCNNFDFEAALTRARGHYAAEMAGEQP
jgi:hypothetical protein